jgi:2-keto-4-pentenoate hydratase/2-oxohepta-3-ene-1,7-dioic acid hydratase in catechol pathway
MKRFVRLVTADGPRVGRLDDSDTVEVLDHDEPLRAIAGFGQGTTRIPLAEAELLAPIEAPEIWCAGVTYERSRDARVEESRTGSPMSMPSFTTRTGRSCSSRTRKCAEPSGRATRSAFVAMRTGMCPSPSSVLLTGTGLVPPDEFSLMPGYEVAIAIEGIGVLRNPVGHAT